MAVFKRPGCDNYYMKFRLAPSAKYPKGKQIYRSCNTEILKKAQQAEIDERVQLGKAAGEQEGGRKPAPLLKDFVELPKGDNPGGEWWVDHATAHYKVPSTRRFVIDRVKMLLAFPRFADKPLNRIEEKDLDAYITSRTETVKNATINRDLATLRFILKRARRWKYLQVMPEFELLEEAEVGQSISIGDEEVYMNAVGHDHRDFALICIETAMMPAEAADLRWPDVHFGPVDEWADGYIYDRCRKTKFRPRPLAMTPPLVARMKARYAARGASEFVFPADRLGAHEATPLSTFQTAHQRLWQETATRKPLAIPKFRIYDFRHTCLSRAFEHGAREIELMHMAGWSSLAMAKRYIKVTNSTRAATSRRMADGVAEKRERRLRLVV